MKVQSDQDMPCNLQGTAGILLKQDARRHLHLRLRRSVVFAVNFVLIGRTAPPSILCYSFLPLHCFLLCFCTIGRALGPGGLSKL
jgi:hypothetical protein